MITRDLSVLEDKKSFSVLIIGAGINGIGTFRDLAMQGVDVLIVDRGDFCSGASAASSHMVHGGIRYLENGEFRLVREAVKERNRLIVNAPHLVKPLATSIPIFNVLSGLLNAPLKFLGLLDKPSERGAAVIKAGLVMYDGYTGPQSTVPRHEFLLRQDALKRFPMVNSELISMAIYYDAAMPSPERIALEVLQDGVRDNPDAVALNYVSAVGASQNEVTLRDELTGNTYTVQADLVINAAGPWIDFVNDAMGQETRLIGGTKGSHIVLDHPELFNALKGNEFFFENEDGRIVLVFPVLDRVIVGTSDIRIEDPDDAVCTDDEVDYFINLIHKIFPDIPVDPSHIVFRFSGVRPLPAADAKTTGQISRDHSNKVIEPSEKYSFPIFNLIGGKWTTFRAFSEQVSDKALKRINQTRKGSTEDLPIGGGANYPLNDADRKRYIDEVVRKTEIDPQLVEAWLDRYGTGAETVATFCSEEYPEDKPLTDRSDYSTGEIAYLTKREGAVHIDDILLRRTVLGIMGYTTPTVIEEVSQVMAGIYGWSEEDRLMEIGRVNKILEKKHQVVFA